MTEDHGTPAPLSKVSPMKVDDIAGKLSEGERAWVLSTPLQEPSDAGVIAHRAAALRGYQVSSGNLFAAFARRNLDLFQRLPNCYGTAYAYRLTPLGLQVRAILQQDSR